MNECKNGGQIAPKALFSRSPKKLHNRAWEVYWHWDKAQCFVQVPNLICYPMERFGDLSSADWLAADILRESGEGGIGSMSLDIHEGHGGGETIADRALAEFFLLAANSSLRRALSARNEAFSD